MNKVELFFKWCDDNRRDLKRECHYDTVKHFDADADVWTHRPNPFDSDPFYGSHTCVRFSDGSQVMFNYKGEVD